MDKRQSIVVLFLLVSSAAFAQSTRVELFGVVKDPAGLAVPGAVVELKNGGTEATTSVTTGADGIYRFAAIAPGNYELTVRREGFSLLRRTGLSLRVGDQI